MTPARQRRRCADGRDWRHVIVRRTLSLPAAVLATLVLVATALAASPQFKHGGDLTLTDSGSTLTLNAAMTGLGNGNLDVDVDWTGTTINNTAPAQAATTPRVRTRRRPFPAPRAPASRPTRTAT
jgi:hypothetical protein